MQVHPENNVNTGKETSIRSSMRGLMKEGFWRSAYRGTVPRLGTFILAGVLTWGTYEAIKFALVKREEKYIEHHLIHISKR